jgi:predicted O-methyltransferase YrrM
LAVRHLQVISSLGWGQDSIQQLSQIRDQDIEDIQVDVDSVSLKFKNAGCEIVRVNDALAYVEALSVSDDRKMSPFDIIFVDADKTRLPDYMEVFLKNDRILKKGGAIIVDNVLWKGAVVGTADEPTMSTVDPNQIDTFATEAELKKSRRARKLANIMHQFNTNIMKDARVEVVILPIRDGLSLIRKRV